MARRAATRPGPAGRSSAWPIRPPSRRSSRPGEQAGTTFRRSSAGVASRPDAGARGSRWRPASRGRTSAQPSTPPAPHADPVRSPGVGADQRPRGLPRRRTRRLVRGRAAHRLPAHAPQQPRPVGGKERGQGRQQRVGRDLLRHSHRLPPTRHRVCTRAHGRRVRQAARCPCCRGLPDDHEGCAAVRASRRHARHVHRRRAHSKSAGRASAESSCASTSRGWRA